MIIYPYYCSFREWADFLAIRYPISFQDIDIDESNWQSAANKINQIPDIAVNAPPSPDGYKNWKDWALRLIEVNY